jgi:hypothetical protein
MVKEGKQCRVNNKKLFPDRANEFYFPTERISIPTDHVIPDVKFR